MKNLERKFASSTEEVEGSRVQFWGRRAFIVAAASAVSGAAFWGLHRATLAGSLLPAPLLADTQPVSAAGTPAVVTIVEFSADGKKTGERIVPRIVKSDAEWRRQLSPISYEVTRRSGTERAYSGSTWDLHERGIFRCICCDTALFSSETKFDSGTGWPSFWQPIARENVVESNDSSLGVSRTAVSCRRCAAHLGHVFDDGPPPTGLRYCMNSAAMRFVKLAQK